MTQRPEPVRANTRTVESAAAPSSARASEGKRPPTTSVAHQNDDLQSAFRLLLQVEAEARRCQKPAELMLLIANETRKLTRAKQIFVLTGETREKLRVAAVSDLPSFDRNGFLALLIEMVAANARVSATAGKPKIFSLSAYAAHDPETAAAYPFQEMAWVTFERKTGEAFAAMLLAREAVWSEQDTVIAQRLGETFSHAWCALEPARPKLRAIAMNRAARVSAALAVGVLMFFPVSMSALAPVEIVAADPTVVAAPADGGIAVIPVQPSQHVKKGDVLLKLVDVDVASRLEAANKDVAVAESKVKQAAQIAFDDVRGKHDIGISEAELSVKIAERNYAASLLARTTVKAERDGLAVFHDKRDLEGRPVSTGERIMEIANPSHVEARIDLPVADAIALEAGGAARLYLDVDPLHPWDGVISRSDYRARMTESNVLGFRTFVTLRANERPLPRLGLRGTAQIYGRRVPFIFYALRRPISAARQWFGL